ncbi:MAG: CPBP family intramembrane metalloprotease [Spirochaetia bacterium]|nr:CPBP family intramembrane metalloprotease [Spirochaetia bacterium]
MKKFFLSIILPLVLFFLFFSPTGDSSELDMLFNSPSDLAISAAFSILQIIIILILLIKSADRETRTGIMGLKKPSASDIMPILRTSALLICLSVIMNLAIYYISVSLDIPDEPELSIKSELLPLLAIAMLLTGYNEELFFRAFMLGNAEKAYGRIPALIFSSAVFALGHMYQGVLNMISIFIMGMILGMVFQKHRNIHINAISHGLYNLFVILTAFLAV